MLNQKKFHFIICYNNEQYMQECTKYISFLNVPDGIETEIIGITGAPSITAAYQAAMEESDAEYKAYLHQDVLILNKDFIRDILCLFQEYPEYGMLGMIGSSTRAEDACDWKTCDVGRMDCNRESASVHVHLENPETIMPVAAINGMVIVTCKDIAWGKDGVQGFGAYDISQSQDFWKAGYQVGIPHQDTAWCFHECGQGSGNVLGKEEETAVGAWEYHVPFGESSGQKQQRMKNQKVKELLPLFESMLSSGQLEKAAAMIDKTIGFYHGNQRLCTLQMLSKVMLQEKVWKKQKKFCPDKLDLHEMIHRLIQYKFLLRRLEYDKPVEDLQEVMRLAAENEEETMAVARIIATYSIVNKPKAIWKLAWCLEHWYGKEYNIQMEYPGFPTVGQEQEDKALTIYHALQAELKKISQEAWERDDVNPSGYGEPLFRSVYDMAEELNRLLPMVGWEKDFYGAYCDTVMGKDALGNEPEDVFGMERFLSVCQEGLKKAGSYLQREKEPLVSVLVAVYNGEGFLEDTLQSVLDQTYQKLQVIVVDDCSKDSSRKIIDRMARQDSRIERIYLEENANVCNAVNVGFEKARGKYLALIGHDDIWERDKIEKQVYFLEMHPEYAVCFTLCNIIDDRKQICNDSCSLLYSIFQQQNRSQEEWIHTLFYFQNVFCAPSAVVRVSCVKQKRFYVNGLLQLQDYTLWMDLIAEHPCYVLQEKLTQYRQFLESGSNLSTLDEKKGNRLRHEIRYIQKRFLQRLPDEKLRKYFGKHFRKQDAHTPEELECERAFLLMQQQNGHCIDLFIELFEKDRTRETLERAYHFGLNDFYELNAQPFS